MKNIFKFMSLALVAGSLLFTACKKDDEEVADGVTVTFGTEWLAGTVEATLDANNFIDIIAYKEGKNFPMMHLNFNADKKSMKGEVKCTEATDEETGEKYYKVSSIEEDNKNINQVEFYEKELRYESDNELYAGWWVKEVTIKVSDFDADNLKISATVDATMWDYANWEDIYNISTVSQRTMKATIKNQPFTK